MYTLKDDAILDQWARKRVGSTWHSMGTCKMAPQSEFGVVDATLCVNGVKGLSREYPSGDMITFQLSAKE